MSPTIPSCIYRLLRNHGRSWALLSAAADAFANMLYTPSMWNANQEHKATWFMTREGSTTLCLIASYPSCAAWQAGNAAAGAEIGAVIDGLVMMEGSYWGEMTEPCRKEMDDVWNANPTFNLKATTASIRRLHVRAPAPLRPSGDRNARTLLKN